MVDIPGEALKQARTTEDAAAEAPAPRWYVVSTAIYKYDDLDEMSEASIWTLSRNPAEEGWETDSGCDGYGLTYAEAKELADAANAALLTRDPYRWVDLDHDTRERKLEAAVEAYIVARIEVGGENPLSADALKAALECALCVAFDT